MFRTVSAERNDAVVDAEADGEGRRGWWCIGASFWIQISMHSPLILFWFYSDRVVKSIGALVPMKPAAASTKTPRGSVGID